ncbi:MAG: pantetheine-phosphate adenylyltransferase [Verrucomicrobia bacterium]|nr:pantetheine-phosphate adenylyltransferase [Verrucomicrobiota bacterium]
MKTALFAGTFDPPTTGHLNLIQRSASLCDLLYVAIATNIEKKPLFTPLERQEMLEEICKPFAHVQVILLTGLVTQFATENRVDFLLRGLRAPSDFEKELSLSVANCALSGIETLYLMADPSHAHISSTRIRELGHFGERLTGYVPDPIESLVFQRLQG